jgi:hypothetical protein
VQECDLDNVDTAKSDLIEMLTAQLRAQGFEIADGVVTSSHVNKDQYRAAHSMAAEEARNRARPALERLEPRFLGELAETRPLPESIDPEIILIPHGDSFEARLWRWVSLHWSIPVSGGYGRRMRFLVRDRANDNALIGIIGLTDPVFSLKARDEWLGWTHADRRARLVSVMEAFALGSVPPYDSMLGGKLVAMLATSSEVVEAFRAKYRGTTSRILARREDAHLNAITTQSAFGRSSMYNRISGPDGELLWRHVGLTRGTGDFHLGGELYGRLLERAKGLVEPGARGAVSEAWKASGFRNRRDVLDVALRDLGFDARLLRQHGVRRGVYIAPLVRNLPEVARGEAEADARVFSTRAHVEAWAVRWGDNGASRPESDPSLWRLFTT